MYDNDPVQTNKPSLLFCPESGALGVPIKKFIDFVHNSGYPVYAVPALKFNFFSIQFRRYCQEIKWWRTAQGVIIVGHSKGALIGKYVLDHLNQVKKWEGLSQLRAIPRFGLR